MLCQFCKSREATIHFTNVVNNKVEKIHICPHCAEEKGFDYLKKSNFEKDHLLAGLMNISGKTGTSIEAGTTCPNCGLNFSNFRKTGRLGCSQCYETFKVQLLPVLRSIHGNTRHQGKIPKRFGPRISARRRVMRLQDELNRAVEVEDYEKAALLRDEIASIKNAEE